MTKEDILQFVKGQSLAVIATVSKNGSPEAAVVEFGELDDFTIVIDTLKTSRKYKNLQVNPKVAIVVGWDENITVQINGVANELSGPELEEAKTAYFSKNPRAKKWADKLGIAYFAIKPEWLRYSDLNQTPWKIIEFNEAGNA